MDFGIALSAGTPGGGPTRGAPAGFMSSTASYSTTMQGSVVGTVEYMAPEQARGQTVDQRADVYAFGLILYDMLVGRRRAEHANSAIAELQARMEHAPPAPRTIIPVVPEAVDRLTARCLEPEAAKRYQTSADLAADLDRLDDQGLLIPVTRVVGLRLAAAIATLLLAIAGGGAWWYARSRAAAAKHAPVSVVIADLRNGTGDPTFEHTLEPVLKRALEGAGFVSAYDRPGIARILGVHPPDVLDETAARGAGGKAGGRGGRLWRDHPQRQRL